MKSLRLLKGKVWHRRDVPAHNEFTYRVFYVSYELNEGKDIKPALFSFDRWNAMSAFSKDHGARDGSDLLMWAKGTFAAAKINVESKDTIELVTHPRVFGYVFNPISFYLLLGEKRELRAVICEVNNTFDDNHNYILAHDDLKPITKNDVFVSDKALYVSPFNTMQGGYTFSFSKSDEQFTADIVYINKGKSVLKTAVAGSYAPCTSGSVLLTYITYPMMTLMVIVRVHLQAVKLFFKKVPHTLADRPPANQGGFTKGHIRVNS